MSANYLSRLARKAFRETRESLGDVSTELEEGISGVKVAQAFNRAEANAERFAELNERRPAMTAQSAFRQLAPAMEVLNALSTTIVAGYGGYLALTGVISIRGVVVAFLEFVRRFFFPSAADCTAVGAGPIVVRAGAERIFRPAGSTN